MFSMMCQVTTRGCNGLGNIGEMLQAGKDGNEERLKRLRKEQLAPHRVVLAFECTHVSSSLNLTANETSNNQTPKPYTQMP